MEEPPQFLAEPPSSPPEPGIYRPTLASRRGELIAWLSASGVGVGTAILALRLGQLPAVGLGLALVLILTAAIISFGGWMERNTALNLEETGVRYHSPVRDVALTWQRVKALKATPIGRGWKIRIEGPDSRFSFRTASELSFGSFGEMPLGIAEGDRLAGFIRVRAGLSQPTRMQGGWVCASADGPSAG